MTIKDSANIEPLATLSSDAGGFDLLLLDISSIRKHYLTRPMKKMLAHDGLADSYYVSCDTTVSIGNPVRHGVLLGRT